MAAAARVGRCRRRPDRRGHLPLQHATRRDLPDGVYEAGVSLPARGVPAGEKAQRDLERLAELDAVWAGEGPELMITWEMVEHARTLGAAHSRRTGAPR